MIIITKIYVGKTYSSKIFDGIIEIRSKFVKITIEQTI
jgi:hypothetical protein